MAMNLIIDQGNTFTKIALFEQNKLVSHLVIDTINDHAIDAFISGHHIKRSIISSVKDQLDHQLLKKYNLFQLTHLTPVPLLLDYKTPETLGIDRIAAAVAAKIAHPKTNVLIIDMGTCITIDLVNQEGNYLGGSISPGLKMRFEALNHFTGRLPLVKLKKEHLKLTGDSTESSIMSGVHNGVQHEIKGLINDYMAQYSDLKIVLTGGDAELFDIEPKNCIFADKFLVLKGLNEILNYNEKN